MNKVVEELGKIGIVPVIALDDAKDAEPLAKALIEGGLPCAEVTFRTEAAEESIKIMAEKYPELIVGAGTVLTPEQADRAMAAGSKFIVSPGLNPKVVKHCIDKGYPIVPGTSNPSDVETAIELGLDTVKFFPAEAAGGLKMIKAMARCTLCQQVELTQIILSHILTLTRLFVVVVLGWLRRTWLKLATLTELRN